MNELHLHSNQFGCNKVFLFKIIWNVKILKRNHNIKLVSSLDKTYYKYIRHTKQVNFFF